MVNNVFVAREDLFTASGAGAEYSRLFVVGKICISATNVLFRKQHITNNAPPKGGALLVYCT